MFLEPSSYGERKLDMSYFKEWAGEIANTYFKSGVAPTSTLSKIASAEELSPHQVQVLAGEANKEIHRIKYASAKEKYFAADFPLADAKLVVSGLQADGGQAKTASLIPEPVCETPEMDFYKAFGVEPESFDKTASVKQELKTASVKTENLAQMCEDKLTMAKFAADAAEKKLIKMARQFVLSGENQLERMKALANLDQFVVAAGFPECRPVMAKVAYILGREGLLTKEQTQIAVQDLAKTADQKAPEGLISNWLPAKIVNGEHPLYITLKTFRDAKDRLSSCDEKAKIVQDKLDIVRQKVRAL